MNVSRNAWYYLALQLKLSKLLDARSQLHTNISFTFYMVVKVGLLLWQKISNENLRKQKVLEITQT